MTHIETDETTLYLSESNMEETTTNRHTTMNIDTTIKDATTENNAMYYSENEIKMPTQTTANISNILSSTTQQTEVISRVEEATTQSLSTTSDYSTKPDDATTVEQALHPNSPKVIHTTETTTNIDEVLFSSTNRETTKDLTTFTPDFENLNNAISTETMDPYTILNSTQESIRPTNAKTDGKDFTESHLTPTVYSELSSPITDQVDSSSNSDSETNSSNSSQTVDNNTYTSTTEVTDDSISNRFQPFPTATSEMSSSTLFTTTESKLYTSSFSDSSTVVSNKSVSLSISTVRPEENINTSFNKDEIYATETTKISANNNIITFTPTEMINDTKLQTATTPTKPISEYLEGHDNSSPLSFAHTSEASQITTVSLSNNTTATQMEKTSQLSVGRNGHETADQMTTEIATTQTENPTENENETIAMRTTPISYTLGHSSEVTLDATDKASAVIATNETTHISASTSPNLFPYAPTNATTTFNSENSNREKATTAVDTTIANSTFSGASNSTEFADEITTATETTSSAAATTSNNLISSAETEITIEFAHNISSKAETTSIAVTNTTNLIFPEVAKNTTEIAHEISLTEETTSTADLTSNGLMSFAITEVFTEFARETSSVSETTVLNLTTSDSKARISSVYTSTPSFLIMASSSNFVTSAFTGKYESVKVRHTYKLIFIKNFLI